MDFAETPEHELLRAAGRARSPRRSATSTSPSRARTGEKTDELWQAIAAQGFLGVHLPEEYGGGRRRHHRARDRLRGARRRRAARCCSSSSRPPSAPSSSRGSGPTSSARAWLPGLATGDKMAFAITEPDAGSNSHNLSTTATRDGEVCRLRGTKTYISGVDEATAMLVVARTGTDERRRATARLSLFVVDTDAPGLERTPIPVEIGAPEKQFHALLRRRRGRRRPPARRRGRGPAPGVLRPQPRAHHRRGDLHGHRALRARTRRPRTRASARCGTCRSARTRASRTRWRRRRSSSSWRGS